jgi:dihydroxy-acid dehydratase
MCIGYVGPEAAAGGPIRLLRDGDIIHIDAIKGKLDVELSDEALAARAAEAKPFVRGRLGGVLEKYEALVRPAKLGAVTHSGAVPWPYEASIGETPTHEDPN